MERTQYLTYGGIAFLTILHLVGLAGFAFPEWKPLFQALTPYHLLVVFLVLLGFHEGWNRRFLLFLSLSFVTGFLVEVIGVQTGGVFGAYAYTEMLGVQFWGVPLIIGINWVTLTYITAQFAGRITNSLPGKVILGALVMVLLDVLIEPFAIGNGLWQWVGGSIPLQNYGAWFIIALVMQGMYFKFAIDQNNPIAFPLLVIQTGFFAGGWLLGIW